MGSNPTWGTISFSVSDLSQRAFGETPFRLPRLVIIVWRHYCGLFFWAVPRFYQCVATLTNPPDAAILKHLKSSTDKIHDMARTRRLIMLFISAC